MRKAVTLAVGAVRSCLCLCVLRVTVSALEIEPVTYDANAK